MTITRYIIPSRVTEVVDKTEISRGKMVDGKAVLETRNLGWFVSFEGSWESLSFGDEKPNLHKGQSVRIIIEGEDDASDVQRIPEGTE